MGRNAREFICTASVSRCTAWVSRASAALMSPGGCSTVGKRTLGTYPHRLCARVDQGKAVTAAIHKLAQLIYAMQAKDEEYLER